jgi:hypothetical protein
MRRWHAERPIMLTRWRAEQRRHRNPAFGLFEDGCHGLKGPGTFRKRRPLDCGRTRCALCHWDKVYGYRPAREGGRRGRQNARREALRREARSWHDPLYVVD